MNEAYECLDCFQVVQLDLHGRCPACYSNQVIPLALVTKELPEELLERLLVREAR